MPKADDGPMVYIQLTTEIAAPIESCFDLCRSIDLHLKSVDNTDEQAIDGVTTGLIGKGEEVTWRSRITAYESLVYFQDVMVRGAFRSYCHEHYFEACGPNTLMRDEVKLAAPMGILGSSPKERSSNATCALFCRGETSQSSRLQKAPSGRSI
jgi:ligand-binding SRPBCC domain-containing protein